MRRELVRREAERLGVVADADRGRLPPRRPWSTRLGGEQALTARSAARADDATRSCAAASADGVLREALQDAKYADLDGHRGGRRGTTTTPTARSVPAAGVRPPLDASRWRRSGSRRARWGGCAHGVPSREVARQFSIDPESKAQGGDLGRGRAVVAAAAPLRKAVEATPAGEVSDAGAGPGRLVPAQGDRTHGRRGIRAVRRGPSTQIVSELTRRKRFAALEAWLDAARDKATVTRP